MDEISWQRHWQESVTILLRQSGSRVSQTQHRLVQITTVSTAAAGERERIRLSWYLWHFTCVLKYLCNIFLSLIQSCSFVQNVRDKINAFMIDSNIAFCFIINSVSDSKIVRAEWCWYHHQLLIVYQDGRIRRKVVRSWLQSSSSGWTGHWWCDRPRQ